MPAVMAEVLLDDLVDDSEIFKVGGHSFQIQYIQSTQSAIFKMDDMGGIMLPGECETRENIKFCYIGADYPKMDVKIESLEPDVTIERTFSTTSPAINEEVTVTTILKNEGAKWASNVKYEDTYPSAVNIYSWGTTKKWEGNLNPDEEETITYTLKISDIVSFDSTATVTYKFGDKETTKKSTTETISVEQPFGVEQRISTEAADRDEVVSYNVTITNNDASNTLTVDLLEIILPSKATLVGSSSDLRKGEDKLVYQGAVDKSDEKKFWIKIKASKVGEYKIKTTADLEIFRKDFKEELEKTFNVGLSYILPILNVTENVKSSAPYPIYIAMKNYGKSEVKNVTYKAESDLFDNLDSKKDMAAGTTYKVLDKTLTAPYLEKEEKYNIKFFGSYRSSSGRLYSFEKSAQVTVEATPMIIKIIKEFNKEEFYPGEEIKIKVKLKNLKSQVIDDIDVSDVFPKAIRSSLLGNVTSAFEELKSNQEVTAYSYSVVVPEDYKEKEIEFKTLLNAKLDGELVILKDIKNINILEGENPNATSEEDEEVEEVVEEVIEGGEVVEEKEGDVGEGPDGEIKLSPEKKEGFFKRIFSWVKGLFSFGKED